MATNLEFIKSQNVTSGVTSQDITNIFSAKIDCIADGIERAKMRMDGDKNIYEF